MQFPLWKVTDVTYDVDGYDGNTHSISWKTADARYHVWLSGSYISDNTVLYKNSFVLKRGEPGYFDTRRLDATKAGNAAMIAAVKAIVERDGLKAKAEAAFAAKQAAEQQERERCATLMQDARGIASSFKHILSGRALSYTLTRADMEALLYALPASITETEPGE